MFDPSKKIKLTQLNMTPLIDCVFLLNLFFIGRRRLGALCAYEIEIGPQRSQYTVV